MKVSSPMFVETILSSLFLLQFLGQNCVEGFSFVSNRATRSQQTQISLRATKENVLVKSPSTWDFLDAIYLITCSVDGTSSSRLDSAKEELERISMWDKVKVKNFKADNEDRIRGCYTSHISVLKDIKKTFGKKDNYRVLILEDNIEITQGMSDAVLAAVADFVVKKKSWDVFHLAYMMYVPGLNLQKLTSKEEDVEAAALASNKNIVRMIAEEGVAVGTSSYIVSKSGVEALLKWDSDKGFTDAIPNIMSALFPSSRYASYPMVFHRAGGIKSLVNPQLDDFRKVMFSPALYTNWERLMVTTGLQNNQLFPLLTISLLVSALASVYSAFTSVSSSSDGSSSIIAGVGGLLPVIIPLFVALWGASLFKPGNTGSGFASSYNPDKK